MKSSDRPRVVIAHPGNQYSPHTAQALDEGGMLERYFTSLWFSPSLATGLLKRLPGEAGEFFRRLGKTRYRSGIQSDHVETLPFYEIQRFLFSRILKDRGDEMVFWTNRKFDEGVRRRIGKINFDLLVGYETAALKSFEEAKRLGKLTLLDLAAEHYVFQQVLRQQYDERSQDPSRLSFRKREERIKEAELQLADYILTPSEFSKQTLLEQEISEEKIFLIPLGYDKDIFYPKLCYRKEGVFKILYTGSILKRKGIQYLLQAVKELGIKEIQLTLIGAMGDGEKILNRYRGVCRHLPYLVSGKLASFYRDADIFVMPSLMDAFGMSALEAMGCGTPVIVSENTGVKDIVRNGEDGFVVPPMDMGSLKEKILYFYRQRERVEKLGRSAAQQALSYDWENYRTRIRQTILAIGRAGERNPHPPSLRYAR